MPKISRFECSRCHETVPADGPQTVCPKCAGSLYVRYDLEPLRGLANRKNISKNHFASSWPGMWRYRSVLPDAQPVTLGEGWTPMIRSRRYPNLLVKEEGANPTGSFKARGLAMGVTMARHYGVKKLAVPSAGNAAGALAAYAAAAGIEANIFMPKDVPFANYFEAIMYGANAKRTKAGSTFPRSKNPSALKGRRRWATNLLSNWAGNIQTLSFTRLVEVSA